MKLALGTVQFGLDYGVANPSGQVSLKDVGSILRQAQQYGIDLLDTAIAYGESEAVLGRYDVRPWKVVTKLPVLPQGCLNISHWVKDQMLQSLNRLCTDRLYAVLLHHPRQLLDNANGLELYAALQEIKATGLVVKIGISVYSPKELDLLFDRYPVDLVQAPLNILDRRLVESGWARRLNNEGVELHTRSAFLQGLLLMPPDQWPSKFNKWSAISKEWAGWLKEMGLSGLQACLRYPLGLQEIDRVIVGVDSIDQLHEIIKEGAGTLQSLPDFGLLKDERLIDPSSWNQL